MSGRGKVVCVTGASGYIASWIVKLLLLRGYTVKATVRDPTDTNKTEHLLALDGAIERLKLFKADLLEECSFDQAIEGCDAVFHTASPVLYTVTDPQSELIDPAVKGTMNVLNTCKQVSSVRRVILTSSIAAVIRPQPPVGPNDVVDETFFSDPSLCRETMVLRFCCEHINFGGSNSFLHFSFSFLQNWYALSKTLAEIAAWQFAKDNGIDMVVLNPGIIIGPLLQPTLNFSVELIVDVINGKNPFNSKYYRFSDVRDVALAHVKALETPSANGRYIINGPNMSVDEIIEILREIFPDLCIADTNGGSEMNEMIFKVCVEKVKNLGVEFTPMKSTLRDTIVSLKEKCLL